MTRTVYIAGPMRGVPFFNFPAFDAAAAAWRERGWNVINPADLDREKDGFVPTAEHSDELVKPFAHYMRRDITALLAVDAIAFLPGWQNSRGARVEYVVGEALDLKLFDALTFAPLYDRLSFLLPAAS